MKILAILGGVMESGDLAIAYLQFIPHILQQGMENYRTPFADHEIKVVLVEDAIDAYFEQSPDRIMFVGTLAEKNEKTSAFILVYKMLTREMDKRKFLFTNPITAPPFNKEENFFVITNTNDMAKWFGL